MRHRDCGSIVDEGMSKETSQAPLAHDAMRYAVAARLSVAPMMDWTDCSEKYKSINMLRPRQIRV